MYHSRHTPGKGVDSDRRLKALFVVIAAIAGAIAIRLFLLMVLQHGFYTALAAGSYETYAELFPKRGTIFVQDSRTGTESPLAMNRDVFIVYADTRAIPDQAAAESTAAKLMEFFSYPPERKESLIAALSKRTDPYEPIEQEVEEGMAKRLAELGLPGIGMVRRPDRYYPESELAAAVVGFVGKNDEGQPVGRYGVEGYWNRELAGSGGFLEGARAAKGGWIPLAGRSLLEPQDGADIVLTLDRSLQHYACERLRSAMAEYAAASASLLMLDPTTGAIRAMCSLPDFDPNIYNEVEDITQYNNSTIFTPYEPGSIFKPITMAAALSEEAVRPTDAFFDTGARDGLCKKPIQNAGNKRYDATTMTGILQNSINTGMVYVAEKLGKRQFREAVETFGFGVKEGIELDTEVTGTIDSLSENPDDAIDCYTATGAFGQGITVTPLQITAAFGALANGGKFMKPYIVDQIRYADGKVERTRPREIRQVISSRAATLLSGMLVQVVDHGYGGRAQVPGYYVAGKTGTAQIPGPGGYTEETNHSFVGFAPVDDPAFVMLVKFEKPDRTYAEVTAAPVFADIAKYTLQYYRVPPMR